MLMGDLFRLPRPQRKVTPYVSEAFDVLGT